MFRPQPISSTDARKYFTKIINKVQFSSKSFVIKSYRQPMVRVVNENYIRALEEVIGKKTVNQVMQIAGNDQLFEAEKIEQIKKVFQRRLSGNPRQTSKPQPKTQPPPQSKKQENKKTNYPPPQTRQVSTSEQHKNVAKPQTSRNRGPLKKELLLQNGKNY